jgi:N-glycosidase YbiA
MSKLSLDTPNAVYFYEQEFYVLSNFSAFRVTWQGIDFDTSEHAYHWSRFPEGSIHKENIRKARSAHDAFRYAQDNKQHQVANWDDIKIIVMREIIKHKVAQHEYVKRKLLQTGYRELVENSWRDSFWGWGEDRQGQNMLGKLWMELRAQIQEQERQYEGYNGCLRVAAEALKYLASNTRPSGGQQHFNAEHLYQLASELEGEIKRRGKQ